MEPQTRSPFWYAGASALVVLFVLAGWYVAARMQGQNTLTTATPGEGATTTPPTPSGTTTGKPAQPTVGVVNEQPDIALPNLNRPYTPPKDAPAEVQEYDRKQVADAVFQLKIDPNHIAWWLQLAAYRKIGGDYMGAAEIWIYLTKRWPTDPTAYTNLADLYYHYLGDTAKARAILQAGIKATPNDAEMQKILDTLPI